MNHLEAHTFFVNNRISLLSHSFLTTFLNGQCFARRFGFDARGLRILQIPTEYASMLVFCGSHGVNKYLEIGVSSGGTLFTTHSYLSALNPAAFKLSVGIDIRWKRIRRAHSTYSDRFKNCEFVHSGSDKYDPPGKFDLIFVDGDHSFEGVSRDYEKFKNHCTWLAFHDIVHPDCGVNRLWTTIRQKHESYEFIDRDVLARVGKTCGIGIVKVG